MPRGGLKCPDCGRRFRARKDLQVGASRLRDPKTKKMLPVNDQIKVYICPGNKLKGKHPPQVVEVQRVVADMQTLKLQLRIIRPQLAEVLEEFIDAWREENIRKYRPDIVFGVARSST